MLKTHKSKLLATAAVITALAGVSVANADTYNFGTTPTAEEIAAVDIDVMPDGRGLPAGSGTATAGETVYKETCLACHGEDLQGVKGTGAAALTGGRGSIGTEKTKKTVESYWPYASTVFDYVKRAMPFNTPGSLTNDQIYAVTAYILHKGNIIGKDDVLDASTLAKVEMPNKDGFISDPRPDVFNYK